MRNKLILLAFIFVVFIVLIFSNCVKRSELELIPKKRAGVVSTALSLIGAPYCYGGKGPGCFDCSGFVSYVYKINGYKVPSTTKELMKIGKKIKHISELKKGDILIFKIKRKVYHTAIYIGNGDFVHSPKKNTRVRKESLNRYWRKKFKMGRRII